MANPRRSNGSARDKLRSRVKAEQRPCHLCGHPIDYGAHYLSPRSFALDEVVPVSKGGSPFRYDNVEAAHRCCNEWRGSRDVTQGVKDACKRRYECEVLRRSPPEAAQSRRSVVYNTSRRWLPGG